MSDGLSTHEITILNAARAILRDRAHTTHNDTVSEVRCAVQAETAENAVFTFLNWTNAYLGVDMTYEQLHMVPRAEVEA